MNKISSFLCSIRWIISLFSAGSCGLFLIFHEASAQNVGIGTTTPLARLHITDSSVVFTASGIASSTPGNPPVSGTGRRMMWYADKAAFRAGYATSDAWDKNQIGNYSFATGFSSQARGLHSTAMGAVCLAVGESSVAIGETCIASGDYTVVIGTLASASAIGSTAFGFNTIASGDYSTVMGHTTTSSGLSSTAMGASTRASGISSTAMGNNTTASGNYSTTIGSNVSTSGFEGCLTIGDHSTSTVMQTFVANGFRSRFAGGYRLFTNSAVTIGAFLNADANSWATLSDVRMKENFLPVSGEAILKKIAAIPQFTWNYKGQDVKTLRHYGPMAQDFYKAFGEDALGEIGCDSLINQQDFLGVSFIAIQALEQRTQEIKTLKEQSILKEQEIKALKEMIWQIRKEIDELKVERK